MDKISLDFSLNGAEALPYENWDKNYSGRRGRWIARGRDLSLDTERAKI